MADTINVAIIPGNGDGDVEYCNWYASVRDALNKHPKVSAILKNMPDPVLARETNWIPFMRDELNCDDGTIIIGHSSGAVAAMRYAEKYRVKGLILVSTYISDLGCETERASGYFSRPWEWSKMKENAGFIIQFGSTDDPLVPWKEQREVAHHLGTDLKQYEDQGHFLDYEFPDLVKTVEEFVK